MSRHPTAITSPVPVIKEIPTRWRLAETAGEVGRNLRSRPLRASLLLLLTTVALAAVGVAETQATDDVLAAQEIDVAAGRNVYAVAPRNPADEPTLDAHACTNLNRLPQVLAAGGYVDHGFKDLDASPGTPVRLLGYAGRLPAVLDPALVATSGGFIAAPLIRQLGIGPTEAPLIDNEPLAFRPFEPQNRFPSGEILVTQPITTDYVHECWFETSASANSKATEIAFAAFSDIDVAVTSLLEPEDPNRFADEHQQRPTRHLWLATGLLVGLVHGITIVAARAQAALYRTLGTTSTRTSLIAIGPSLILLFVAAAWAVLATAALTAPGESNTFAAAWAAGVTALAAGAALALTCICTAGVWVGRGAIADHLKERL